MAPSASVNSASPAPAVSVPSASHELSKQLHLPILVFGAVEVRRLQRELEALEGSLQQEDIRKVKTSHQPALPRVSRLLDALASENNCSLLKQPERQLLQNFLAQILVSAPGIHMSFASDPSAAFMAKIVAWLRSNVHPNALLQIGLQPSIAAGCVVRTSNKVLDLSLRQHFETQKAQFTDALIKKAAA